MKMTPEEFLIRYMKLKQSISPDTPYFTGEDEKELKTWAATEKELIADRLAKSAFSVTRINDLFYGVSCPWCLHTDTIHESCRECGYGRRHGICDFEEGSDISDYKVHRKAVFEKVESAPEVFEDVKEELLCLVREYT